MNVDTVIDLLKSAFDSFDNSVQEAVKLVTASPADNTQMWSLTTTVHGVVLSIAITLAVLYFFMDFLNKSVMLEYMKWENVVKSLLKLIVCKTILSNVLTLTNSIFNIVAKLTTQIGEVSKAGSKAVNESTINYDVIKSQLGDPGFLGSIALYMKVLPIWFLMWLVVKIILLIVYGRMIQIYIYTMFAPIPLASLAGEGFGGSAKNFIKDYAGVCLQGTVIIASMGLYGAVMKSCLGDEQKITSFDGMGELFLISLVLIFLLVKSGDWSKKIIGGN